MRVKVYLADGGTLDVKDFASDTALDLRAAVDEGQPWLTLEMDGATVLINTSQIARIDFETGA